MAALAGFLFLNTLYLQDVRAYRPLVAGLCLLPMALALAVCATLSGRIVAARGTRIPMVGSGILVIAGGLLMTRLTGTTSLPYLFLAYVIFGAGLGLVNAAITNSAVSGMPREQAGVAAGVASASRQVGSSLGVAVMGSVLNGNLRGGLAAGFVAASRPGWWIVAVLGAVGLVLALVTTGTWAQRTAARTASLLSPADERSPVSVP
jgi:MFS family permease